MEAEENQLEDEDLNDADLEKMTENEKAKEIDGISQDNWRILEKVKTTQLQDHLKVMINFSYFKLF